MTGGGDLPRCRKCDRRLWVTRDTDIGPKCLAREQAATRPPGWTPPARPRRAPGRPARTWRGLIPGQLDLTQQETTMPRYRKLPVEIDAIQFTGGNSVEVARFLNEHSAAWRCVTDHYDGTKDVFFIRTLEGEMRATDGDWIIRGVEGELYPCKDSVFRATYEPADGAA